MTTRTILLDGVDSAIALVLTTDMVNAPDDGCSILVGYETEAFEHYAPPRLMVATPILISNSLEMADGAAKICHDWLSGKLASGESLQQLVTYLSDFIEEHDNGCGWRITRLKLFGPTVRGRGLTQVLRRPLTKSGAEDEDFEHMYVK